jgi:hypothetical protein
MKNFNRAIFSLVILVGVLFQMAGIARSQSVPFTVGLYYPTNNQVFGAPANIYVHASVTDSNIVNSVQYFSGGTSIGLVTNTSGLLLTNATAGNPFYIMWSNVTAGAYSLTAVVVDGAGNTLTSAPVNISVTNPIVRPAVYIYSPTNGATFLAPTNLTLYARAVESSGTVATVQFFANNASLGMVSNSSQTVFTNVSTEPLYALSWSNVLAGNYALKAVATDVNGGTATSSVVTINVVTNITPPVVFPSVGIYSPAGGTKYVAPANVNIYARAIENPGTVATVQFFANSINLGVVSNISQMIVSNISSVPLFPLTWSNAPVGTYDLRAVATDTNGNSATSSVVSISIVTNTPPPVVPFAISVLYPANGQQFLAPASIGVRVLLTDSNIVRTVQFYSGQTSIGIITNTSTVLLTNSTQSNPFYFIWSNILAGNYSLTAVATDSAGNTATSAPVSVTVTNQPLQNIPFAIGFWYPTNGQSFAAPASIGVHALVLDSNIVQTVQYFANGGSIGTVSNSGGVLLTSTTQENPFFFSWSNVLAGSYALTAVATDNVGNTATSSVVNITVTNVPPPVIYPSVAIYSPANGATYHAPTNVNIYARAVENAGMVATVQFFANNVSLGVVSNTSQLIVSNISTAYLFPLTWSNVPVGSYELKALATDTNGNTATSSVVVIGVLTNTPPPSVPFTVAFWYPTNGQLFVAPANVGVHARVTDSNVVQTVQYFANGNSIGVVTNTSGVLLTNTTQANSFFLDWSNVLAGNYSLTAVATDSAGITATSAPVNIYVVTNPPPVINIYATDPVAVEGTNYPNWYSPNSTASNYVSGANTATFLVRRDGSTNTDLTVYYSIGGTAINGEDYETLPGSVVIPAGKTYALITIYPLDDSDSDYRYYDTVVLSLIAPPTAYNSPATYTIGSPQQAGAIILEENFLPIPQPVIHAMEDSSLHISLPATNGMNYSLQISTDMVNWLPISTNTVLKGSAQFVDPSGTSASSLYYRIVPVAAPASY